MDTSDKLKKYILSVGGSLVFPPEGLDITFLSSLNSFIRARFAEDELQQFFIVIGGGTIARKYQNAGAEVLGEELTKDDLDWLGIHATRMNAHLVRTLFRDIAHPNVIKDYENLPATEARVVVGAGWKPGWSTDYDAVLLAEYYKAPVVLNLSNVDAVYDRDPKKHKSARALPELSWDEFTNIVGETWVPGMSAPFDPVAAKKAHKLGLEVVIMDGTDFENLGKYFRGEKFSGTRIISS